MGLRTTSRTPSLASKEDNSDSETPTTSLLASLNQSRVGLHPDAANSGIMAPALTEPLSPTNKLSSSAASASPRPTAGGSPPQTNNNNNNTSNNNNDSTESVDENPSGATNSVNNNNNNSGNREKPASGVYRAAVTAQAKGAFQLAFEQSVGVRHTVVNGDALSANSSQMGPMCDSKSSQPPLSAANSAPLIKSKISQIDAETAAKIITSQFGDFPSDIEEAITAEICLRQELNSSGVQQEPLAQLKGKDDGALQANLFQESKEEPMDETPEAECSAQQEKQAEKPVAASHAVDEHEEQPEKDSQAEKKKLNIISVQELPPIKTDSTVTASEDDNIEERLKQLDSTDDCPMQVSQESGIPATPPRTPSAQMASQLTPTNSANIPTTISASSLTPQSTTSTIGGGSISQKDFKDTASEMDHDIEDDLLQVLKGFDTTSGGDICDLAGFLSDYAMNYEDVNPPNAKENPLKEVQAESEKNQQTMQRKIDFLLRRLRKLQARYMSKQASEEISGLFEWSARTTKRKNSDSDHQQLTFAEEKYHPVSTTTMRNVLKKIESVATSVQHVSPVKKPPLQQQALNSSKADMSSVQTEVVVPWYDDKVTEEIAHVSGLLQSEMREVQSAIDSDATASSSGGESADEMVTYNNPFQEPLPISKRAAWRYSRDRAAIASRWSWLLSQIADLEFKIRQHSDLHEQMRKRKGRVVMLTPQEASTLNATTSGTSVNGYRGSLPGGNTKPSGGYTTAEDTDIDAAIDAAQESSQGACRTRAFQSSYFRKRKLFQTANVHTISKKAARPSTIKCGCQWPLHPCALCTGRSDPTAPRDLPDTMMMSQRVALLDPGFHPVLSFPEDISHTIYFEAISRDPEWQNRVVRSTAKSVMRGAYAAQRAADRDEHRSSHATSGRITPNTPAATSTSIAASTGKRKYTKRNHQDILGGGGLSTTPLVANKLGKGSKKHRRHRSPDYVRYPKKNHNNSNSAHHQLPSPHRNAEQSNHHPAHSSSIYQNTKNNKIRKLSSASATAAATTATPNQSESNQKSNQTNQNYHHVNSQHHSYNNELNFLHCDSLDGAASTNGLTGLAGRSRTSSPTHGTGHSKVERSLERKSRTSYDIDNIVIPYSVAAATRVEILPYKEIPTPKWRIVDYDEEETKGTTGEKNSESSTAEKSASNPNEANENPKNSASTSNGDGDEDETEDNSDEAMILRHERALIEERRKFQTFLKFPWSTRSRANRIDSRAESSGANTPDPTSPAPNTPSVGGDQESIPSPFAPSTPLTTLDSIAEGGENSNNVSNPTNAAPPPSITSLLNSYSKRQERRRTVSAKKDKDDQRRSSTPDLRELIPPYEPLVFPIPDDLFGSMLKMMPDEYPPPQEDCPQPTRTTATTNGIGGGHPPTPAVVPKNFCDQKINNNNKNAFLTLNQKSFEHITGEDDIEENDDDFDDEDNDDFDDVGFLGPVNGCGGDADQDDIEHRLMAAPATPIHSKQPAMAKEVEYSPFICRNNLLGCSDTESLDSETGDDDPNDPEWKDEPE